MRLRLALLIASSWPTAGVDAQSFRTAADLPEFDDDARVAWAEDVVRFRVAGVPHGVAAPVVLEEIVASAVTWNRVSCAAIRLEIEDTPGGHAIPGDGINTIEFVTEGWTNRGLEGNAAATTDVAFLSRPGEVVIGEADLLLNADDFTWGVAPMASGVRDIQAVVTHELGHALGIRHPCEPNGSEGAPRCSSTYEESALYPVYLGITQRILGPLDRDALCYLYPPRDGCECQEPYVCSSGGECARPCNLPSDCSAGPCVGETCAIPEHAVGDPCVGSCTSGLECSDGGVCLRPCDEGCPRGNTCDDGLCVPALAAYGSRCDRGEDCGSGLCILREGSGLCTRRCVDTPCPRPDQCEPLDGEIVCSHAVKRDGCSATNGGSSLPSALLLIIACWQRRRTEHR